jgi:hypothetical protein
MLMETRLVGELAVNSAVEWCSIEPFVPQMASLVQWANRAGRESRGMDVNRRAPGSGLVKQNNTAASQQRPRHADELALPVRPVLALLRHCGVKPVLRRRHSLLQLHVLQRVPQLRVRRRLQRVL